MSIHPSAIISKKAKLGKNVTVGPYAIVEDDVIIGDNCQIDSFAIIAQYTTMGKDNHIYPHAFVGGDPQDLKFAGEKSELIIGDSNKIREFTTLHRGTAAGGSVTSIGSHNLIMAYCHVAHDCTVKDYVVMSNNASLAGHCYVGEYAIIGGLSALHQFTRVGAHAFVGGMTGIVQDLPPWMLAIGDRGTVQSPNFIGLRRMNASQELISAFKRAFRLTWKSELPRADAMLQLNAEYGHLKEIRDYVEFIQTSERGILLAKVKEDI